MFFASEKTKIKWGYLCKRLKEVAIGVKKFVVKVDQRIFLKSIPWKKGNDSTHPQEKRKKTTLYASKFIDINV